MGGAHRMAGKMRPVNTISIVKTYKKRPLGSSRHIWNDNITSESWKNRV